MGAVLCMIWYCHSVIMLLNLADTMKSFFAFDIANRVEHERELVVPPAYIAIDVPMGTFSSVADGILQIWLLTASPVNVREGLSVARYAMTTAIVIFWIISFVCKGTQIWALVQQIDPKFVHSLANGNKKTANGLTLGLEIYQYLNTAASGMMFLFSIGYAIFSFGFVYRRRKARSNAGGERVATAIGVLATCFFSRNAVMFAFTLIYAQLGHIAPLSIQLVYLAFYGILSVGIYTCIRMAIKAQTRMDPLTNVSGLNRQWEQSPEGAAGWQPVKPQASVGTVPYINQDSYGSYRY